ncbi:MAG TPA: succinate dehydrogenase assembly factor 2 [Devosiaceae bacterium]|nr:succinate dehydrogenase assembly factor 2 [Devosiaceae bacterium]
MTKRTGLRNVDDVTCKSLGPRRKRARFRAWHRGTRELDLLLGGFADARVAGFDGPKLDRFEELMNCADPDLFDWISGGVAVPEDADAALIAEIAAHVEKGSQP